MRPSYDLKRMVTTMDHLPSYDEATSSKNRKKISSTANTGDGSIQCQTTRSQHIVLTVNDIVNVLNSRSRKGFNLTTIVLVPRQSQLSKHEVDARAVRYADSSAPAFEQPYELVAFPERKSEPVVIPSRGELDTLDFWSQISVLQEMKQQILDRVWTVDLSEDSDDFDSMVDSRQKMMAEKSRGARLSGRSSPSATVYGTIRVELEEIHVRYETPFGLYETKTGSALILSVLMA